MIGPGGLLLGVLPHLFAKSQYYQLVFMGGVGKKVNKNKTYKY
jgi:hypothetical protein